MTRAPLAARRSSGSLSSTPRRRRSSSVVARVVMRPRVTCRVPPAVRVSRNRQNASTYPSVEATATNTASSATEPATCSQSAPRPNQSATCRTGPIDSRSTLPSDAMRETKPASTPTVTSPDRVNGPKRIHAGRSAASSVSADLRAYASSAGETAPAAVAGPPDGAA